MTFEEAHRLNQSIRVLSFSDRQAQKLMDTVNAAVVAERTMCAAVCDSNAWLQRERAKAEGNDYATERAIEAEKCAADIRKRG